MAAAWQDRLDGLAAESLDAGLVIHVAQGFGARRRGLARMEAMPADHALRIPRTNSVHTFGMRFALDLVWLGRGDEVVRIDSHVPSGRLKLCLRARSVIETRAGHGDRFAHALD